MYVRSLVRKEKENQGRKQRKQPMMQRLETKALNNKYTI